MKDKLSVHYWYHGTLVENISGTALIPGQTITDFEIDPKRGNPHCDFGRAFYMTTRRGQAVDWANALVEKRNENQLSGTAVLLRFEVDLSLISSQTHAAFIRTSDEYKRFVRACRVTGTRPYGSFDLVYGPVVLYPQRSIISDSDQIAVCTESAARQLGSPFVELIGASVDGMIDVDFVESWDDGRGYVH